jgi:phosphoribosylaminoimidazole-succinocarboxamide synthase
VKRPERAGGGSPGPPGPPGRPAPGPEETPLVLGIDPGTRTLGFAVLLAGANPRMREFGAVRLKLGDPLSLRLKAIHQALGEVIVRHRPQVVVVEEAFYGKNFQSAIRIGEARGVAILVGAMAGLPVVQYSPAMVKKAVTGNGAADKRQVQRMVARLLGLEELPEPLDASDALAIAFCHARRMGRAHLLGLARAAAESPLQSLRHSLKRAPKSRPAASAPAAGGGAGGVKGPRAVGGERRRAMRTGSRTAKKSAQSTEEVLLKSELPGLKLVSRGKVRDLYDLGLNLLLVASDRLSAFDVVLPDGIPDKGKVLTRLSVFWFETLGIPSHLVTSDVGRMGEAVAPFASQLKDRSMLVRRLEIFPIECVVRGYLAGSGWIEYQKRGSVCGVPLPKGLRESDRLPRPIFTPTTKASAGHDEPMTFDEVVARLGAPRAEELRDRTIAVYQKAADYAIRHGIIICDTKLEWGIPPGAPTGDPAGSPAVLADEVLTPDSSRFWPEAEYQPGRGQPSFDKQYVRDYLNTLKWDKRPPGPKLPPEVIARTAEKYREIYQRLTGRAWA